MFRRPPGPPRPDTLFPYTTRFRSQQQVRDWTIAVEGGEAQLHYSDHLGNGVDLIAVAGGARELVIRCRGEVELLTFDGVIGAHRGPMPLWTFLRPTALTRAGRQVRMLAAGLGRDDFASEIGRAHALSALQIGRAACRERGCPYV